MKNKNLHSYIFISAGIISCLLPGCSKTIYDSGWQSAPVSIDGNLADWTLPFPYYDPDTKLNYNITNDAQNLYVCMRVNDFQSQMKMLKAGFTLWLDTKGSKDQTLGIRYPLPQQVFKKQGDSFSSHSEKPDFSRIKKLMLAEQKQMQLMGFTNVANGTTLLRTAEGIAIAMDVDSTGDLIYEATIPFKTFLKEPLSGRDTLKAISIGMTVNGLSMQGAGGEHHNSEGRESGMHSGGSGMSGGMHGGGGHGGSSHGGGMGGGSSSAAETKTAWNYIRLVLK